MRKIIYLILLIITIYSVTAYNTSGSPNWLQEGNAGLLISGGISNLNYYSTNQNNILTPASITYSYCNLPTSNFPMVGADFTNVNETYYAFVVSSQIRFYTSSCSIASSIPYNGTVYAPPTIRNFVNTTEPYPEIYFNVEDTLEGWEYDGSEFNRFMKFNYTDYALTNAYQEFLVCPNDPDQRTCMSFQTGTDDIIIVNTTNSSIHTKRTAELSNNLFNSATHDNYNGLSATRDPTGEFLTPICFISQSANILGCDVIDSEGIRQDTLTLTESSSGAINDVNYSNGALIQMDGAYFYLLHYVARKTGSVYASRVYDESGFQMFSSIDGSSDTLNQTSNWVTGYFTKLGYAQACFLRNRSDLSGSIMFECFDNGFLAPLFSLNATGVMNITHSLTMGDFFPNSSYLTLADQSGIYYANGTNIYRVFNTSQASREVDFGQGIIISESGTGSPVFGFSDPSRPGKFISNLQSLGNCGNGVCGVGESPYNCPQDCGTQSSLECINNSDCPTNYPLCIPTVGCVYVANYVGNESIQCTTASDCPLGTDGSILRCIQGFCDTVTCTQSSDCPYDRPVCVLGACVTDVSGGIPDEYLTGNASINAGVDDEIQRSIDILSGGSATVRFIIGIIIVLGFCVIPFTFGQHHPGSVTVMIFGLFGLITSTALNFIPIYVLILTLVTFLAIGIFYRMFIGGQGAS